MSAEHSSVATAAVENRPFSPRAVLLAMRPWHWLKNGFVLAPLLFSRSFHDPAAIEASLWAVAAFSLTASAVYVWNDLMDAKRDQQHPVKRYRPIASGALSPRVARAMIGELLIAAGLVTVFAVPAIWWQIAAYLAVNAAYSLGLKRIPWLDVALLSLGFVLRVDAGAVAIGIVPSGWMKVTTLALAVYLATLKRYAEMASNGHEAREALRHYDAAHLRWAALAAGSAAVGCYSLFALVERPSLILTLVPVAVGILRYGWLVLRRAGSDSPFRLIARDRVLLGSTLLWGGAILVGLW